MLNLSTKLTKPNALLLRRLFALLCVLAACFVFGGSVRAHVIPRSDLEMRLAGNTIQGHLDAPLIGLGWEMPGLDQLNQTDRNARIGAFLAARLQIKADNKPLTIAPAGVENLPDGKRVRIAFTAQGDPSGTLTLGGVLFPTDPNHKTFVSVYRNEALVREAVWSRDTPPVAFAPGEKQSTLDVIKQFVREGIHHIFIGPDHILFIAGLMLLGGSLKKLLKIVTAFTLAHSITLALATLNIVNPSPRLVEPTIALSIVFVGLHTLWVQNRHEHRDMRVIFAALFGLIHGFGFASVLREMELPPAALGWSLFSFNVGVEIGQMCIVLAVAPLLALLCQKNEKAGRAIVQVGSWCVVLAGAYWFGERLFG